MRQAGALLLVTVVAVVAVVGAAAASGSGPSPQTLYQRLLTTPISDAALPSAYSGAKTGVYSVSSTGKKHHEIGGVEIDLNDGDAVIIYMVFPTRADAVGDWKDANLKKHAKTSVSAPADFPWPALIANMSVKGKNVFGQSVTNGVTDLAFTSKNVIVQALTLSTDNKDSGDVVGSIKLGHYALKHLQALRAHG